MDLVGEVFGAIFDIGRTKAALSIVTCVDMVVLGEMSWKLCGVGVWSAVLVN